MKPAGGEWGLPRGHHGQEKKKTPTRVVQHQTISRLFWKNKSRKSDSLVCVSPRVATTNGRLGKRVARMKNQSSTLTGSYIPRRKTIQQQQQKNENKTSKLFLSPVQKIFKKLTWFFLSLFRRWAGWLAGWCDFGCWFEMQTSSLSSCWLFTIPRINRYISFSIKLLGCR